MTNGQKVAERASELRLLRHMWVSPCVRRRGEQRRQQQLVQPWCSRDQSATNEQQIRQKQNISSVIEVKIPHE